MIKIMEISREEILRIADLACLKIEEKDIDKYTSNLQEILNFAKVVTREDTKGIEITVGANNQYNVFRKDEIKDFEDKEALLENAPEKEIGMFKIPRVM